MPSEKGYPFEAIAKYPVSWAGTSIDMRAFGSVTIGVTTAPATAYNVQRSPDGVTWYATGMSGIDMNFNIMTNIPATFTGAVTFQGNAFFRLNGGTGGAFQISGSN